jgi:hypothetical protein
VALIISLFILQQRARSAGIFILALWNLLGVVLHELSHLLAGLLFRARPIGFSLIPERSGNSWRLGSVSFAGLNPFSALPVALAPLGLAGAAYVVADNWFNWFTPSLGSTLSLYATVYILLYNALPSVQDLKIACNWRTILLYGLIGIILFYIFRAGGWTWPAFLTTQG